MSTEGNVMPPLFLIEGMKKTKAGNEIMAELAANGFGIPGAKIIMSGDNEAGKLLKGSMSKKLWRDYFDKIFFPNLPTNHGNVLLIIDG